MSQTTVFRQTQHLQDGDIYFHRLPILAIYTHGAQIAATYMERVFLDQGHLGKVSYKLVATSLLLLGHHDPFWTLEGQIYQD
jgi:hypothetical protein